MGVFCNTTELKDTSYMFYLCNSLPYIDFSGVAENKFDTSKVTNFTAMFDGCSKLTVLDLSNFDTSLVTDMSDMFQGCSSLTDLDISSFNTSNVTDMDYMFGQGNY